MRTDTIFYQLFLTFNSLLFELLGKPVDDAAYYQFISTEIKEKAFRFDGIFMPDREDKPLYFVEVQFQNKPDFYWELIAEINLYLNLTFPVIFFIERSLDSSLSQSPILSSHIIINSSLLKTVKRLKPLFCRRFQT